MCLLNTHQQASQSANFYDELYKIKGVDTADRKGGFYKSEDMGESWSKQSRLNTFTFSCDTYRS